MDPNLNPNQAFLNAKRCSVIRELNPIAYIPPILQAYLLTLLYACASSGAMLLVLWRRWRLGPEGPDGAAGASGGFVGWIEMAGITVDG